MQSRFFTFAAALAGCLAIFLILVSCGRSPTAPNPAPSCTFVVTPASASIPAAGGTTTAHVETTASCSWTASAGVSWITLTPSSGTGSADIVVTVRGNDGFDVRSAQITIAEKSMSVRQEGRTAVTCDITLDPESQTWGSGAGNGRLTVRANETCSWTAQSLDAWLTVRTASGTGPGAIDYEFSANQGTEQRETRIVVGDRSAIVRQDPPVPQNCQYSVAPIVFSPCMPSTTLTSSITTQASCSWTASPGASWITIVGASSGTGPGVVSFTVSDNYDAPRNGVVMVRWPTPTEGQNVQIAQAGCHYGVSKDALSFTAAGGTGTFDVLQQSDPYTCGGALQDRCVWTAQANVSWITITSSMPRSGDNPVAFTVAPNSGAARTGTITVRDKVVTITQAGI